MFMAGGTCHIHDNYTIIHPSSRCIILADQNAGNCMTIQLYNLTAMHPSNACIVSSVRAGVPKLYDYMTIPPSNGIHHSLLRIYERL